MEIKLLTSYTPQELEDLKVLLSLLSDKLELTEEHLKTLVNDSHSRLYVIYSDEKRIIGCATLCILHTLEGNMGNIEDVVISSNYRGQHLGRKLMEHVLREAKQYAPIQLHLTSNPRRIAANNLYPSLHFEKKETNVYQLLIP